MLPFEITLAGEVALIEWRDQKIHCEGYIVDDEIISLALAGGLGEGIGVLLVAINEYCSEPCDLGQLLKDVVDDDKGNLSNLRKQLDQFSPASFLYQYLSFSPDVEIRAEAARKADFNHRGILRMIRDREEVVLTALVKRGDLEEQYYPLIVKSRHARARLALLEKKLPNDLLEILSRDREGVVRWALARKAVSYEIFERLAVDDDVQVRLAVAKNIALPVAIALNMAEKGDYACKFALADSSREIKVLNYLFVHGDDKIKRRVRSRRVWIAASENKPN